MSLSQPGVDLGKKARVALKQTQQMIGITGIFYLTVAELYTMLEDLPFNQSE